MFKIKKKKLLMKKAMKMQVMWEVELTVEADKEVVVEMEMNKFKYIIINDFY